MWRVTVDADEPRGRQATLAALTDRLGQADPGDTAGVLGLVWDGLALARMCGLEAASAAPVWKARQGNAQACEYDTAAQLASAPSLPSDRLQLVMQVSATLDEADATAVVTAIEGFTTAAISVLREAGTQAGAWPDQRGLLGSIAYLRSLGESWSGRHSSYTLQLPARIPPWWPSR
jgi:hypothetical protein